MSSVLCYVRVVWWVRPLLRLFNTGEMDVVRAEEYCVRREDGCIIQGESA